MKNKLMKLMGVVLTLAILAGLLITAVPVSAAVQSWSTIKGPPVTVGTSANVFAFAGDGTTVYMWPNFADATYNLTNSDAGELYKSTDAGITWSSSNLDTGAVLKGKTLKSIKVNKNSAADLVATDGIDFFRSTNSGRTWGTFSLPDSFTYETDTINSIDVANGENGIAYLAATSVGVFLYDSDLLVWVLLDEANWSGNALAAAFSPNYENVPIIVAVALDTDVIVRTILVSNAMTSVFGGTIMDCTMKDVVAADTSIASIAFPSNYSSTSSTSRVFIGIGETDDTNDTTTTGIYRINGGTSTSTSYDLGANINVSSLAMTGSSSNGNLVAGAYSDFVITSTNNVGSNSPTWSDSTNSPFGDNDPAVNMQVAFAPSTTTLYAGAAGLGSGLSTSKDFLSFAAISFVSVSHVSVDNGAPNADMPFPGGGASNITGVTQFQLLNDKTTGANMIFKTTDSGATWKVIYNNLAFNNGSIKIFSTTPGDKEYQTLWLFQNAPNADKYVKSTDGGANWDTFNFPSIMGQVDTAAVIDANSFWMGSSAGIRKSTSTAIANIDGKTPLALITIPNFFVIPSTSGEIYISKDDGATFDRLGNIGQFNNGTGFSPAKSTFAFNGKNWTVYAVDVSSGNILQWVYGVDSAWTIALSAAKMPANLQGYANISGISIGGGGVWYVQHPASGDIPQLWRAVDPLNPNPDNFYGFEGIDGTSYTNFGNGTISAIPTFTTATDADGIPTYYTRIMGPTATNKYPSTWVKFTDVLISAPKITVPTEGAVVGTTVTITQGQAGNQTAVDFTWSPVAYTGARYGYQIAYDAGFTNIAATNIPSEIDSTSGTTGTTLSSINLLAGKKYFFRVKVLFPMMSKWSTAVSFNTMIPSDVNQGLNAEGRISPINGSSNVPLSPAITWGAVNSATSYDFKLATDSTFTTIVESKDGLTTTVFSPAQPLKPNTVYFWEVRANAYTNVGNWVVSAFTTGSAAGGAVAPPVTSGPAAPPATVIVTQPAITVPPAQITVAPANITVTTTPPETPAYIWIIIAIGAVLVIAVIVLIARTRRV